jgi:hypothetical protein
MDFQVTSQSIVLRSKVTIIQAQIRLIRAEDDKKEEKYKKLEHLSRAWRRLPILIVHRNLVPENYLMPTLN